MWPQNAEKFEVINTDKGVPHTKLNPRYNSGA